MALEGLRGTLLDQIFQTGDRRPAYRVLIWNPRKTTVQDVALERWTDQAYDISQFVERVRVRHNQVFENNDEAVSSRMQFEVVFDERDGLTKKGGGSIPVTHKLFREGTPVRVYEGDQRILKDDWVPVFTGVIKGFPSAQVAKQGKRMIRVSAFGRAQTFQRQIIVGKDFGYGADLGDVAVDLAMVEMALEREEIRFGSFGHTTRHKSNALTAIDKMKGLFELMATVGRKPYFDGFGRLVTHVTDLDRPPAFTFNNSPTIVSLTRQQNLQSVINSVQIVGLSHVLTEVVQSVTRLAEVTVTVGYFDSHYRERIYYSRDQRRRAKNTFIKLKHKSSFAFGSSIDWVPTDEFSGQVSIDTGYAPWVIPTIILVWAALVIIDMILEASIDASGEASLGLITVRLIVQVLIAASMLILMLAMTTIGRYEFEVWGQPFEFVFEELRSIAFLAGTKTAAVNELAKTHHWLTKIEDTDLRARKDLRRELAKAHPHQIVMLGNPMVEVDDLLAIRAFAHGIPRWSTFYVETIDRSYERAGKNLMTLNGWFAKEGDEL